MIIPVIVIGVGLILLALPVRRSRRSGSLGLAELADRLAVAVGAQWEAEARRRRLNDPYPLPVSWTAADRSLTDSWGSLVTLATSGAGWPEPPLTGTWASSPADLAGKGEDLVKVVTRVPTGRLVVLGEPGAGKTILMVRLVLDLLVRRAKGGPVPILASVASWDPASQPLRDWLAARLLIDHPALADPPADRTAPTQAEALLVSGLILPILDGLDEIPEEVRGPAISRINDALRPGEQVVATCRSKEYLNAIRPRGGTEATLRAAAAIELQPLDADAVREYLCDDAAGPVARARWAPVLAVLGTDSPAGQALRTPLMVSLARAIYNPRPGELVGTLPDPVELCHQTDKEAVESLLFDAYIPAAYRSDTVRWNAQDLQRWLVFLARHLEHTIASPDLAWWQLQKAIPPNAFRFGAGLVYGLVAGLVAGLGTWILAGFAAGFVYGFGIWVVAGLVVWLGIGNSRPERPARRMRISVAGFQVGYTTGLMVGLGAGLGTWFKYGLSAGLAVVAVVGLWAGLLFGLPTMLEAVPSDLEKAMSPRAVLASDRRVALLLMLETALVAGLAAGLGAGFLYRLGVGLVVGLVVGLTVGLTVGLVVREGQRKNETAWSSYMLTRGG
jgi:hypothetical protein